jgi:hypothetical protein
MNARFIEVPVQTEFNHLNRARLALSIGFGGMTALSSSKEPLFPEHRVEPSKNIGK